MDVAASCGYYPYVTEMKSVLPSANLVSPLRSSHPMNETKKTTRSRSGSSSTPTPGEQNKTNKRQSTSKKKEDPETPKLAGRKRPHSSDKKR